MTHRPTPEPHVGFDRLLTDDERAGFTWTWEPDPFMPAPGSDDVYGSRVGAGLRLIY